MPQDNESDAELKNLAAVPFQLISPANNKAIIGIFQDSMLGCYRFTRENIKFTPREAMNLLMMFSRVNVKALFANQDKHHGIRNFEILSQILPPMTLYTKNKLFDDKENNKTSNNVVEIKNGTYVRGQMDKGILEAHSKGLIQRVCNDFGNMASSNFIDDLQNVITEYMKTSAFSVGISDLMSDSKTNDKIIQRITEKKNQVKTIIDQTQMGIFENDTGRTNEQEFEMQVNNILNQASSEAGKIGLESLDKNNRFVVMVNAGSKGSELNISQMISCLGQQNVDGKRIPYGFENRTLPHFSKYDDSPGARGFVESSFINGLSPQELFFHAMGGRVGLIDTAVKSVTWETPIVLIQDKKPIYTKIGEWIDGQLDNEEQKSSVQHFTARNMELLEIEEGSVFIPTTDADGKVTWGPITAITRHDPGTELYEIKTKAGRSVIVTESKSLLVWHPESKTFLEKPSPEIKVGDFVPVTKELCEPPVVLQEYKQLPLNYKTGILVGLSFGNWEQGKVFYGREPCFENVVREDLDEDSYHIIEDWLQEPVIPSEAFIADESFVLGIINGFFSINGNVEQDLGIYAFSEHVRLLEGVSMLLSRFGIFASIQQENNCYTLSIRGTQAQRFSELVEFLDEEKGRVWRNMDMEIDQQQQEYNDVVLDPIVEINIIGVEKHPKVYDLTIPTTLNFGLANGLQVRDTSTTGYIQRRLIKGLEDLMVSYDMTLRTNKNKIVQFCYGEDAVDTTKVENQVLPLVNMTIQEIYAHFNLPEDTIKAKDLTIVFEKSTWKRFKSQQNKANEYCKKYTDYMLEARDKIVEHVFKKKGDNIVNCPVAFQYIIGNIQGQQNIHSNSVVDLTFSEAFEMIEHTFHNLETLVYAPPTELFKTLYFYYLSPKDLLLVKRFNRAALTLLLTTISLMYKRAIVAPGEMVGMIAAQSIGEVSTQMTLNTFHNAGISAKSNVTRGVPRIEEILSLSSEPKNPSLTIHLKAEDETDKDKAHSIMYMIEHTRLQEVVKSVEVCFDPDDLNTLINDDKDTMQQYRAFEEMVDECVNAEFAESTHEKSKWLLRMEMDVSTMLEKNITMDDVHFTLKNSYGDDISCMFSDYNADKLVFRIRMNDVIKQGTGKGGGPKKVKVSPLDQSDQIFLLKNFQDQLLQNVVLRGVKGINKVSLRKIKDNVVESGGAFKKQDIWVLDTIGTNMMDVMALDYIDKRRVFSNNIAEVYDVLGIEAARQTIYNEITEVIEFDGTYINYHHFSVLCDRMTSTNKMISIFRHGINSDNIGPVAKASFEETPEMFLKAARHAELDTMRGISANVMCGQEGFFGTSAFQVVLDIEEMKQLQAEMVLQETSAQQEIDKVFQLENQNDKCSTANLEIQNNVINIKPVSLGATDDDYDAGF